MIFLACSTRETEGGKCCVFPFKYKGKMYSQCTDIDWNRKWCSLTNDYDSDRLWDNCTGKIIADICVIIK